jgi:hypothetical protein
VIAELDRNHGIVLRQMLVEHGSQLRLGVVEATRRVDAFSLEGAAFLVKHSSKRLSPWQFTYTPENIAELTRLSEKYSPVWIFLVCGQDGVVGLSTAELATVAQIGDAGTAWLRVSRSRNSMYRVAGGLGELPRAKSRGVQGFLTEVFRKPGVPAAT